MWFDSWSDVVRVVAVGTATYLALIVLLRLSGKRTLAKLNAFDLVVTVALGSILATILLSSDVSWLEGLVALTLLVLLQLLVTWSSTHLGRSRSLVTARPTTVLRDGVIDERALASQRLTPGELRQAVRSSGIGGLDKVARVVVESDGTLSVIPLEMLGDGSALEPEEQ